MGRFYVPPGARAILGCNLCMPSLPTSVQRLRQRLFGRYDYFYVLDFGNYSLRWALLKVDRDSGERTMERFVQSHYWYDEHIETGASYLGNALTACRQQLSELPSPQSLRGEVRLIIGLSLDGSHGHSSSHVFKREDAQEQISKGELANMLQNAQHAAFEEMRKVFSRESGLSDTDIELANTVLQEVRIDDRAVKDPLGLVGGEVRFNLFNCYYPSAYRSAFSEIQKALGVQTSKVVFSPYAVFSALARQDESLEDALMVNVGGRSTRVSLMRKRKLESGRSFAFGGEAFTKRVASEFNLTLRAAEEVKLQYARGEVSEQMRTKLDHIFEPEVRLFLDALEMILKEFVSVSLLPGSMYLYGGGSALPVFDAIMKKRKWKQELSFLDTPKIRRFEGGMFRTETPPDVAFDNHIVSLLALCDYAADSAEEESVPLQRLIARVLTLIQD